MKSAPEFLEAARPKTKSKVSLKEYEALVEKHSKLCEHHDHLVESHNKLVDCFNRLLQQQEIVLKRLSRLEAAASRTGRVLPEL